MRQVELGDGQHSIECSVATLMIYEQEFNPTGDPRRGLVQDLFGKVELASQDTAAVDFTQVSWTTVAKALWAMLKTAEPLTQPFGRWVKGIGPVNLNLLAEDCFAEANEGLFHPGEPAAGDGE